MVSSGVVVRAPGIQAIGPGFEPHRENVFFDFSLFQTLELQITEYLKNVFIILINQKFKN